MVGDRDLFDAQPLERGLDQHLGRELHARGPQIHGPPGRLRETPQTRVSIRNLLAKQEVEHARQDRVADVTVRPGHGAGQDLAHEARSKHDIGAGPELFEQERRVAEVVSVV